MPSSLYILTHNAHAHAGSIETVLREQGMPYTVIHREAAERLPSPDVLQGLIVLGGEQSSNDETRMIHEELALLRVCLERRIPVLGVCLGLQLLVKAGGGSVTKAPVPELGFRNARGERFTVEQTDHARGLRMLADMPAKFHAFHSHYEMVQPADTMSILCRGDTVPAQMVQIGERAFGTQFHFELTDRMFEEWFARDHEFQRMNREQLEQDLASGMEEYARVGRTLAENFVRMVTEESV